MIPQKQLSLADIFEDCKDIYESDKPHFLTLLENHIDLDKIIPTSFYKHYYASTGRNRKYPLHAMLWALIIQRLFSIPTDSLLLIFLRYKRNPNHFFLKTLGIPFLSVISSPPVQCGSMISSKQDLLLPY